MGEERYMIVASQEPMQVCMMIRKGKFPKRAEVLCRDIINDVPIVWVDDDNLGHGYAADEAERILATKKGCLGYEIRPLTPKKLRDDTPPEGLTREEFIKQWNGPAVCVIKDVENAFGISEPLARHWAKKFLLPAVVAQLFQGKKVYDVSMTVELIFNAYPDGRIRNGRGGNQWRVVSRKDAEKKLKNGFMSAEEGRQ